MTKTTFKYNGKKNTFYAFSQGCLLGIAITAVVTVFSIGGIEIFSDYPIELLIIAVVVIGMTTRLFKKKSKNLTYSITVDKESIYVVDVGSIPLTKISVDIYSINDEFSRYHLYDSEHKFAMYSVFSDEFIEHLKNPPVHIKLINEISSRAYSDDVVVKSEGNKELKYSLTSGFYQFNNEEKVIPDNFMYDPKFYQN